tara:strand:- start:892 stop:1092 length:201 start_codon:yes stop_codon:yes gene_type:complete
VPAPRFELGTTKKIMKKHYLCSGNKGKSLNMVPSSKLPNHFHTGTFLEELFFVSYLRVIGMEVLGT